MLRLAAALRNPFSFLFARSSAEDRVAQYIIREHGRGRPLRTIMDDPYVRNRMTDRQRDRLLDRPEIIHAVGDDVIADTRAAL